VSGQFTLSTYAGVLTTDRSDSWAYIKGVRFDVTQKYAVEGKLPDPLTIYLVGPGANDGLTFVNVDVNKSYDILTAVNYYYYINGKVIVGTSKLTITR
jgi:hypothetical protein